MTARRRQVLAEAIEPRLLLSAGSPDPAFGNAGTVLDQESTIGFGVATAFDPTTGDIIDAGTTTIDADSPTLVEIQRYSSTGALDLSFGVNGTASNGNVNGNPDHVVVQPDGKILLLASYFTFGPGQTPNVTATLARYTATGAPDETFGFDGFVQFNSPANSIDGTFLLLPNGNILLPLNVPSGTSTNTALEELNPDGSPDTSFGSNGIATGAPGILSAITLDSNNNIVAVGSTPPNSLGQSAALLERFTSAGQLDSSFGTAGSTTVPSAQSLNSVFVESSGAIQAVSQFSLYDFTSAGALNTSFGSGGSGFVALALTNPTQSLFQPDGKILLAGETPTTPGNDAASLVRINPDGSLDTTFGSGGHALFGPGYAQLSDAGALSLQSNGKIILGVGNADSAQSPLSTDFDPTRLNANGTADASFGVDGTAPGRPLFATGDALAELPNDQTLVAGEIIVGGVDAIYLRRYNADGSVDSTFAPGLGYGGTSGYVFIPTPVQPFNEASIAKRITLDSTGRILLAITNYGILRLTSAGKLDTTFGKNGVAAITSFDDFALAPNGQILVTSGTDSITRLTTNGIVDATFGSGGSVTVPTSSGPIAIQPDEKILVGGSMTVAGDGFEGTSTNDLAVTRLNINGTIDTTFGIDGTSTADYNKFDPGDNLNNNAQTLSLTVLSNGNILAGAEAQLQGNDGNSSVAAAEFLPNGKLNTSFGDGGEIGPFSPTSDFISLAGVIVQPDGSFILAGGNINGSQNNFFLARFTTAGIPDTSFGADGVVTVQFTPTIPNSDGPFDTINSVAATSDGKVVIVGDAPNQSGFGFAVARYDLGLGTVSGTVYNDLNDDGIRESNEPGIPDQTVFADLGNNGGWVYGDPQTTTDSNGNYTLTGLPVGSVVIREILLNGQRQTFPSQGFGQHVNVGPAAVTSVNFGATSKLFISGTVFNDANGNGKQDPGESGISGWTIYADLNNDGKFESNEPSKTVGTGGNFSFFALNAGTFIFRVIPPAGWRQTFPINNFGQHVTLAAGGVVQNLFFGFAPPAAASISGTVFNDANGDQKLDNGESGISGWEVYIDLNNNGKFVSGDPETTTDANGDFSFNGLFPGTYIVRVVAPAGWSQTTPTNNFGQHITVTSGQMVKSVLFGEKKIS